jgi:hypothetical protein
MKNHLILTVAAVLSLFTLNFTVAQTSKIRSNKEILFEASINSDNRALIRWVNQSDHQSARFIVQRSRDNETFFDIREIAVKQDAVEQGQQLQFAFTDSKFLRNTEYYRIVEYEVNGLSYTYSSLMLKPISPISIVRNGDISFVRVIVEDSKNLTALVTTETGLGVPCEFEVSETNDVILKPAYSLNGGSYLVKLRSSTGEKQFKFTVKSDDVL